MIQKCTGIMRNLLYNQNLVTAIEPAGRLYVRGDCARRDDVPYAQLELEQLLLKKDDRALV